MNGNKNKLSIITINLNNKAGLERTIQSVVSQSYLDYEFIIIDGSSTDGSAELLQLYQEKIVHGISEKDSGIYHAMNKGIRLATGDYCLFLNSGDYLQDDVLQQVAVENFSEDIIYGDLIYDFGNDQIQHRKAPAKLTLYFLFCESLFHPASFIKKNLFNRIGMYDEQFRIAGDYDFFFNAIVGSNVSTRYIPIPIAGHNANGISSHPENFQLIEKERSIVHEKYLTGMMIEEMKNYVALKKSSDLQMLNRLKGIPFLWRSAQLVSRFFSRRET